jgi:CubicO group peptidase (beta-lactamase class C family)
MNARSALASNALGAAMLFLFVATGPAYGQNGAVGIAYPASGITVDGDLSDWPEDLRTYPIGHVEAGDPPRDDADLKASFRIAYNVRGRALYVAVEVRDDSIVLDGPGEAAWDAQDGCELYIDAAHSGSGSPVIQYARYGDQDRNFGPYGAARKAPKVAVVRTKSRIVYEWRVELDAALDVDRVIGFDVSVADRDKDGSFSWAAWGRGTSKLERAERCGEVLLVRPETRFGEVSGRVQWKDKSASALPPRVRIQSSRSGALWRAATVDATGTYRASSIPVGPYSVHAVDSPEVRVDEGTHVDVQVVEDEPAAADVLAVVPVPWPGLIGTEGVLRAAGALDTCELDRFIHAYLAYFKVPGLSLAVIKDAKVVYRHGYGLRNTMTQEPVTADTVFEAASMTKPVFAYLVLRLVDRGVLELDTPLYTYFPYDDIAHDDRYKLITARMVLTHRTGFPNWRSGKLDIKFTPGTQVSYSGEGFVYLGKVVEHLTGKTLADLCRDEVFALLGVENASLVWNDAVARATATGHGGLAPFEKGKPREPNVAASLHIDAGNYAKFLTAVVGGEGLSAATAKEMLRPQVKNPQQEGHSWGLGIDIEDAPAGTSYGHGGRNPGFTSRSLMDKERGIGCVLLVNNDDADKIDKVLNAYLIAGKSGLKESESNARK